jgi:hypothetical protein
MIDNNEMEEVAKTITIYISHGLEIIAAAFIAAALIRLIIEYFQSVIKVKNGLRQLCGLLEKSDADNVKR